MSSNNSFLVKCYDKILDCFKRSKNDIYKRENCKNQSIIKLMKILRQSNDKEFVGNALIFVLSLFNGEAQPDFYSACGNDLKTCSDREKQMILSELKKEFL